MTGAPMPTDAASRMQMAPDVYKFTKDFAKKPNILEKSGNLLKNIAKTTLMGAAGLAAAPGLIEQQETTADNLNQDRVDNQTAKKIIERKGAQFSETEGGTTIAEDVSNDQYMGEPIFRPVQMPSMVPAVGVARPVEMPSMVPAVAPVPTVTDKDFDDLKREGFADPKRVQKEMESDMVGEPSSLEKVTAFLGQKNLEPVLIAAMEQSKNIEDMVGSGFVGPVQSPLTDNSQSAVDGGESTRAQSRDFYKVTEPINVSSSQGTIISPSTKSTPSSDDLDNILSKALANKTPQERETVKQQMLRNMNAGREGFMAQDGPNKPSFEAKQRILEKTGKEREARIVGAPNVSDKVEAFKKKIMPDKPSSFVESMSLDTSPNKAPTATFNLYQKDGSTKPFTYGISSPMAVSLDEMVKDESLPEESFGQIMNLLKKSIKDDSGMGFYVDQ
jgi:hypothetical protein